jgi:hypothetical protein
MKKYIFSGYEIQKENSFFVFDSYETANVDRDKISIFETPFTITRFKQRFCIGRYDLKTFESFACPHRKNLSDDVKGNICMDCFKFNSFNPSFYNMRASDLSSKQREYNLSPHNVYLVAFSEAHIKVGISHHERTLTRWLEQGARVATIIYKCENAYDAREIEERITKELKLLESYRGDSKRQLLSEPLKNDKILIRLDDTRKKIENYLNSKTVQSENFDLNEYYLRNETLSKNIIDVSNESPLIISGLGIGLIGDTLIFKNGNQQFMVSLKKIQSHQISFISTMTKQNFKPVQISLF